MRLKTAGAQVGFAAPVIGKVSVSTFPESTQLRERSIFVGPLDEPLERLIGYRAIVSTEGAFAADKVFQALNVPVIHSVRHIDHLRDGVVIAITPSNGLVRTIYRPDSDHNTMFVTERCNSNCLMCSQPPKDIDDTDYFYETNRELITFISKDTRYLTITGGEPTLLGARLFNILSDLNRTLPAMHVHILTNGRSFAWQDMARSLALVDHRNLSLGIPLYSDYAPDHDHIVQAKGAFDQTILGLYQLARWQIPTEVRVVLHKLSIPRLPNLAQYICRNLPFVTHIALMGLEPTGYTPRNRDELWIDPVNYQDELESAVETLTGRGMNVSVYNSQLCVLRPSLWRFARKSISDWKNIYLQDCERCTLLGKCGGLFQSAERLHSEHIHAFA